MPNYPRFVFELISLGKTNNERASRLGVSTKTIVRYCDGEIPEPLANLLRHPQLLRALADDAEQLALTPETPDQIAA